MMGDGGLDVDYSEARRWFTAAALQDEDLHAAAAAANNLGLCRGPDFGLICFICICDLPPLQVQCTQVASSRAIRSWLDRWLGGGRSLESRLGERGRANSMSFRVTPPPPSASSGGGRQHMQVGLLSFRFGNCFESPPPLQPQAMLTAV